MVLRTMSTGNDKQTFLARKRADETLIGYSPKEILAIS
jgi:hypothetical protein